MIARLNGYTLLDNSINEMKTTLFTSRDIKKEIGSTMCSNKEGVITLREKHEEEARKISIKRQCEKGEEYVGYYHTHPEGTSKATSVDLRSCGTSKILCVGGKTLKGEHDNISCYTWKDQAISVQEGEQLFIDVLSGKEESRNSRHRSHFNCLNTIGRYANEQEMLEDRLESIRLSPITKLALMVRSRELGTMVDNDVDKYYNRTDIKL